MSTMSDSDADFIAQAMPAFISEAQEQTDNIEQLLLQLEENPGDKELLDSLFRSAHTVKGSAGIFGLNKVVEFTHHVETLLDRMRDGEVALTAELNTLLLQCNDQIKFLVASATDSSADTEQSVQQRAALITQLQAATAGSSGPAGAAPTAAAIASAEVLPDGPTRWNIVAKFGPELYRNGMDPLSIVRYLGGMGEVISIRCNTDKVPPLVSVNPESCFLSFEMALESKAARDEVEGAFSFVMDDCELEITVTESTQQALTRKIEELPPTPRLGDMLVSVGALSQESLTDIVKTQESAKATPDGSTPKLGNLLETKAGVAPEVVAAALGKQQKIKDNATGEEGRYIRVQADRLDAVINLLGELVIAGAGTSLLASESHNGALVEAAQHMNRLIEEIRNGTLGLRMVPVGETFSRFRRVVRDTASSLGKEVNFEIMGGEAELDKSMVEKIADPLMHLVRNSLDHGLEPPQERLAAGKSRAGHLTLSAQHETGAILIRIEDDGRGINREKVLQRAWDRGLVEPGVVPPDDTINMLIFEPGFSTAEQVTNLSGRGVGMDVVRRNIEALRGSIRLTSNPGVGLQVDIRLPLTLAIIDGFMVGLGRSKFVLPLESVVEVISTENASVDASGRRIMELRGTVLPVISLRALYGADGAAPERSSVVVIQSMHGRYGIEIDTLLGQHQTVIKPLGRLFKTLRGISGSSILGSGEVALILDVNSLAELASSSVVSTTPLSHST